MVDSDIQHEVYHDSQSGSTHISRTGHKFALNENFPESPGVAPNTVNHVVLET